MADDTRRINFLYNGKVIAVEVFSTFCSDMLGGSRPLPSSEGSTMDVAQPEDTEVIKRESPDSYRATEEERRKWGFAL